MHDGRCYLQWPSCISFVVYDCKMGKETEGLGIFSTVAGGLRTVPTRYNFLMVIYTLCPLASGYGVLSFSPLGGR